MSERSSTTHQSSPAIHTLDGRGRQVAVSLALSLIAFALHVAFCTESPLINSGFRHSIGNWIAAVAYALPGILLSLLAVPAFRIFPRLRLKWAPAVAFALWFGLIIRLAAYAIPEQSPSTVRSQPDVALTESLETKLRQVASAANSLTPVKINSTTEIFKVLSNQNTLMYYIRDLNFVLPEMEKSKGRHFHKQIETQHSKACSRRGLHK
jgi:hypothetical protein